MSMGDTGPHPLLPNDPGARVGKFVRTQILGSGGGGVVWKAWDTQLSRWVALKFLKGQDAVEVERFRREAVLAGRFSHPNIAAVHEFGEHEGQAYFAMQYVEGRTLRTWPRIDRRELAGFVRDAARALAFAHGRKIVHRDLKPENIMVTPDRRVYVLDFGMARAVAGQRSLSSTIVGTVNYMAPEQARGERVDGRSDVYSLGATLYELLTGAAPFRGTTVYETLRMAIEAEPPRPRSLDPSIDGELETIVLKCMEKVPERRYRGAKELADDLDRWLAGDPLTARRASVIYSVRKRMAQRKLVLGVAVVALIIIAVLGGRWLAASRALERERSLAIERERGLKELSTLWADVVQAKHGFDIAAEDPVRVREQIGEALVRLDAFVAARPAWPQGYYVRGRGRLYLGDIEAAAADARQSLKIDPEFGPGHSLLGWILTEQHARLLISGRLDDELFRDAESLLVAAQGAISRSVKLGHDRWTERWGMPRTREDDIMETLAAAMQRYYIDRNADEGVRILQQANDRAPCAEYLSWLGSWSESPSVDLEWQTRALARMPHSVRATFMRGMRRHELKDFTGADGDLTASLRIDGRNWLALVVRALTRDQLGRVVEATDDFAKAIELQPRPIIALVSRGRFRQRRGELDGAIEDFTRVVELAPGLSDGWGHRGGAWYAKGEWRRCIEDASRAIEIGPMHGGAYYDRARARRELGDTQGCLADCTQAIELARDGDDLRMLAEMHNERGLILQRRDNLGAALTDFRRAVELAPTLSFPRRNLAAVLAAQGNLADAHAELTRAIEACPADPDCHLQRATALCLMMESASGETARALLEQAIADAERALLLAPAGWKQRASAELIRDELRLMRKRD